MARYADADKITKDKFFNNLTMREKAVVVWLLQSHIADVVEVKHGEWIVSATEFGWNCCEYPTEYTCSVCGRIEKQQEPYCHCGAKMDGGEEE